MKKRVLVVFPGHLDLGGVERSLLGLLNAFDYERYDVDLFLFGHHGELYSMIDPRVNLLPEVKELAYLRSSIKEKLRHGCWYSALLRLRDAITSVFGPIDYDKTWGQVMRVCAPLLPDYYDLALSFFLPFDFLNEKVKAKRKVGWIHTDYTSEKHNLKAIGEQYDKAEVIAAVSDSCRESFGRAFPEHFDRTIVVENILSPNLIRRDADAFSVEEEMLDDGAIRLLSVGRFCTAKNFDNVPDICRRIRETGLDVKWYLIGFGGDEALIRQRIAEAGMQDHVIILGKKANPYPYMKACDVYVQPSRYEGNCVCVHEAQMLGRPVVITKYATSASQLEDGVDGVIVPMDNEGCAAGIAALLRDEEKQKALIDACANRDYSNAQEMEKLYKLMQ